MKFTVTAGTLVNACRRLGGVIDRKTSIPILANVLLEAAPGKGVTLTGTDLDVVMRLEVLAGVEVAGRITVSADMLAGFAGKLDKAAEMKVALEAGGSGGDRLTLASGRSRISLVTLPAEDFPHAEAAALPHEFALPAADLAALLAAGFACSTEETRYYLNGVYLHVAVPGAAAAPPPAPRIKSGAGSPHEGEGGRLRAVATDGHRLARVDRDVEVDPDMPGVIVQRKTVKIVAGLCGDAGAGGDVDVAVSETGIQFAFAGVSLRSKVIDGTFPDYARVIPRDNAHVVTAWRTMLIAALDRVAVITDGESRAIRLVVTAAAGGAPGVDGMLRLDSRRAEIGEGSDEVDVSYAGPALPESGLEVGLNAKYLGEVLRQVAGDRVALAIADGGTPVVFTAADCGPEAAALFVVMPMRV